MCADECGRTGVGRTLMSVAVALALVVALAVALELEFLLYVAGKPALSEI